MSGTIHSTTGLRHSTMLHRRLLVFVIGGALAVLAVGVIELSIWRKLAGLEKQFATLRPEQVSAAARAQYLLEQMNGALLRFQLSNDPAERDRFLGFAGKAKSLLPPANAALRESFTRYLRETEPLLDRALGAVRKDSADRVQERIDRVSGPFREACAAWAHEDTRALDGLFTTGGRSAQLGRRLIEASGLLLLVTIAGALFLAYAPMRSRLHETDIMLERQEKLASLGTLATGIAHEIRNPLAAIKLRLFSLRKALPAPLAGHEDLSVIKTQIDRLDHMLNEFLLFARPADPKLVLISARDLIQSVHALLRPQLEKKGVCLDQEAPAELLLTGDKEQLEQVLVNLVQNAADSVDQNGTVTLRARQGFSKVKRESTPFVVLEVSDTGRGIPPEVQERIFDPFFSTRDNGTGLGLAIAARIVEKHGGFIQCQSQLNRGTTFSIVLPRPETHVTPHPAH